MLYECIKLIWYTQGPDTVNFEWAAWGNWSDCIGNCSSMGEKSRHRICIPPMNGGYECPAPFDSDVEQCETAPCPGECYCLYCLVLKTNVCF